MLLSPRTLALVGVFLLTPCLAAAEPEIDARLNPSHAIRAGETCELVVSITWNVKEGEYRFSALQPTLERLAVEEAGESNETLQVHGEEWRRKTFRYTLKALEKGRGKIYPFHISYVGGLGQNNQYLEVQPQEIIIRPNHSKILSILALLLGIAVTIGLSGFLLLRLQSTKGFEANRAVEQISSLEERCLAMLKEFHKDIAEPSTLQEAPSRAARLFRSYFHEKYSLPATAGTRYELIQKLSDRMSDSELKTVAQILDRLEQLQFGGRRQSYENFQGIVTEMIHYIEGKKVI